MKNKNTVDINDIVSFVTSKINDGNPSNNISDTFKDIGYVVYVGDSIVKVSGLSNVMFGEVVVIDDTVKGVVFNLEESSVGIIVFDDCKSVKQGSLVKRTNDLLSINVDDSFLGRVIDPLLNAMDGGCKLNGKYSRPVEVIAPGISKRYPVSVPVQTGIKAVDAMIPIGRGQRQLIIGDRNTGKTSIAVDAIINQKSNNMICVYVAIGQKDSTVASIVDKLSEHGAMDYTVVINASASFPPSLLYLAPYVGTAIGEYFMYHLNKDVLCVYDDLTKHANSFRELSLLMNRPPGREAFPGDVFYLHSRLLERAVRLNKENGGGSLTALPIVETQEGEVSSYIPTNVISITDGQIYLSSKLFASGILPAIDVGISVSRVGGSAQISALKKVAGMLRLDMASFRSLESFTQVGSEDLDDSTKSTLNRGYKLVEILKQENYKPCPVEDQVLVIYAANYGAFDFLDNKDIKKFELKLLKYLRKHYIEIFDEITQTKKIKSFDKLNSFIDEFIKIYKSE